MATAATPDNTLTDLDKAILRRVQANLPDSATPFADIAAAVGASEAHVLALLARMKENGQIRRFGATLKHQKAGYGANVMVAWFVPEEDVDRIGAIMAERPEVSHCYHRVNCLDWPYNLYTMVHGRAPEDCRAVVDALSQATGCPTTPCCSVSRNSKRSACAISRAGRPGPAAPAGPGPYCPDLRSAWRNFMTSRNSGELTRLRISMSSISRERRRSSRLLLSSLRTASSVATCGSW